MKKENKTSQTTAQCAIHSVVCSALTHLVETLNKRLIHPEKDADLLMEELQEIGVYHTDDKGWYIDID